MAIVSLHRGKWTASPTAIAGLVATALLVGLMVLGPPLMGAAAARLDIDAALQGPSARHFLGTDELGRDILARVVAASRLSLSVSIAATLIGVVAGTTLGALPAIADRRVGQLVGGVIDFALAFPALLLSLFVAAIVGAGLQSAMLAIAVALTPIFARLTQTLAAGIGNADFIAAARLLGIPRRTILTRHVIAHIAGPILVTAVTAIASALIVLSSLSFLGLGVQGPQYDWGTLLSQGLNRIYVDPAPALAPAAAIVAAGLGLSLTGEMLAGVLGLRRRERAWAAPASLAGEPAMVPDRADEGRLLRVEGLNVDAPKVGKSSIRLVHDVTLALEHGARVAIVGESGSGKTMTALAIARLLPADFGTSAKALSFLDAPLLDNDGANARGRHALLGRSLSVVFQDPLNSFNPVLRVGPQLAEVAVVHGGLKPKTALARAADRLRIVGIDCPERRARQYPHEFSGGMLQRGMIGMGLMLSPRLIIADEPTTALDVTIQKQILELIERVCDDSGAGLLLISHDLAVVSRCCSRILVMYAGRIVEDLSVEQLSAGPAHPYTRALREAALDMTADRAKPLPSLPGRAPAPGETLQGCAFAPRCDRAIARCRTDTPELNALPADAARRVACWRPGAEMGERS